MLPSQYEHILARLEKHASRIEDKERKLITMCIMKKQK